MIYIDLEEKVYETVARTFLRMLFNLEHYSATLSDELRWIPAELASERTSPKLLSALRKELLEDAYPEYISCDDCWNGVKCNLTRIASREVVEKAITALRMLRETGRIIKSEEEIAMVLRYKKQDYQYIGPLTVYLDQLIGYTGIRHYVLRSSGAGENTYVIFRQDGDSSETMVGRFGVSASETLSYVEFHPNEKIYKDAELEMRKLAERDVVFDCTKSIKGNAERWLELL